MQKSFFRLPAVLLVGLLLVISMLSACQGTPAQPANVEVDLAKAIKAVERAPGGWKAQEELKTFNKENLFELMDGQSDAFFVYGFEKAAVQRYNHAAGITLVISLYQVDAPDSAYGLFSVNRDQQLVSIGNEGSATPGRRLSFWQSRYFVQMTALKAVPDDDLMAAARAISAELPKAGETPALVQNLPAKSLAGKPAPLYFHQELTIQDRVWLGGENKLGLGLDTDGVLARYDLDAQPVDLMIIEYPDATRAGKGLQALQSGDQEDLLAAAASGKRIAAVFGKGDPAAAEALLAAATK